MSGTGLIVLHAFRRIGFASVSRVSEVTGLPEDEVESELIDLAVSGLVTYELGVFRAWGLTEEGWRH